MMEVLIIAIICGVLFGFTWGKLAIIGIPIGIVSAGAFFYLVYPPLLILWLIPIAATFLGIGAAIGIMMEVDYAWIGGVISAILLVLAVLFLVLAAPIMSADSLYRIPRVDVVQGTTAAISPDHIRIVPEENALWRAEKLVGGLGYKEDAYDCHIQTNDGSLAWLCPYDFNGATSAFWYGSEGVSGYVVIDAEHPFAEPRLVSDTRMMFTPNAIFNNNLIRHIYFEYPDYFIKEPVFHIDDKGKPKWVTMLAIPTVMGITGEAPVGMIVTDPETGRNDFYDMDKVPSWVKRTWSESTTEKYLEWWGTYVHGFWNSVFGQRDIKVPTGGISAEEGSGGRWEVSHGSTDVYLIMGTDNRLYWYSAYSTAGNMNSMVGYMLVDVLTGKFTFHEVPGTYNDLSAAKNVQQHSLVSMVMGHHVTQPIMYVLNGEEVWIIPVVTAQKENAGVGIVRAKDGTTFYAPTLEAALAQYEGNETPEAGQTGADLSAIRARLTAIAMELEDLAKRIDGTRVNPTPTPSY